jgi:resuscitation-promoting factor RpfA
VAFGALAVTRLTGGGPNVGPAVVADGTPLPSVVASSAPARTEAPTAPASSPDAGPTRTLVPSDVEPTPSSGATAAASPAATPVATQAPATYTVKSGDTLSEIASAHGMTWQELAKINGIKDPSKLRVGQVLKLR